MRLQTAITAWFDLPSDPDGAKFEIKHLLAGELSGIIDKTHKQKFEFVDDGKGGLKPIPTFEIDSSLDQKLTVVGAIVNWQNVLDKDATVLPCTDENKERLCNELSPEDYKIFIAFIVDCRDKLAEMVSEQAETERKN